MRVGEPVLSHLSCMLNLTTREALYRNAVTS